ncbi:MAG: molecular chaperone HtpG [Lentisphaeria bacterium]
MTVQHKPFKTEVQQLLDLVIHSLYSNRDIFLRELISNASDAIDRLRFEALSAPDLLQADPHPRISIVPDKAARTLTLRDNGIGMNAAEVEANIGTIASSGTRRFLTELKEHKGATPPELIGQFGVGFYSAFMVADRVTLLTRRAGADTAVRWASDGSGEYTLEEAAKADRGTEIVLHLKEGMDEYLDGWKLRKIIKTYSDFVEHPVVLTEAAEDGKEAPKDETVNSQKALWQRPKNEITAEEYAGFYRHLSHDFDEPLATLHWQVEGAATEFRALVFIPKSAGLDFLAPERRPHGLQLYVRRVFISDHCEALLPPWLRFLRGVVDSGDLPLNVSRELLQDDKQIRAIRNNLVKKVLDTLAEMKDKEREKYETFWKAFGPVLKEGMHLDFASREKLQELLLFPTAAKGAGTLVSLAEYVQAMPEAQKAIYHASGENRGALENAPHLEAFRAAGWDVLLLTDPIDDWVMQGLTEYAGKPLRSVTAGGAADLPPAAEAAPEHPAASEEELKPLLAFLKKQLGDQVKDVQASRRLTESACCLVADEHGMGVHMEKIMRALHKDAPPTRRVLEINPAHPVVRAMAALAAAGGQEERLGEYAEMLHDQALLTAGQPVADLLQFTRRVSRLMADAVPKA